MQRCFAISHRASNELHILKLFKPNDRIQSTGYALRSSRIQRKSCDRPEHGQLLTTIPAPPVIRTRSERVRSAFIKTRSVSHHSTMRGVQGFGVSKRCSETCPDVRTHQVMQSKARRIEQNNHFVGAPRIYDKLTATKTRTREPHIFVECLTDRGADEREPMAKGTRRSPVSSLYATRGKRSKSTIYRGDNRRIRVKGRSRFRCQPRKPSELSRSRR